MVQIILLTRLDGFSQADGKQAEKGCKSHYNYESFHCICHCALVNGYRLFSLLDTRNTEMSVLRVRS